MATIKKRNNKYCVIYNYVTPDGQKKQKWETYNTKEEAKRKIEDALILMDEIQKTVIQYREKIESLDELVIKVCNTMGTPGFRKNPLFKRTIESFME